MRGVLGSLRIGNTAISLSNRCMIIWGLRVSIRTVLQTNSYFYLALPIPENWAIAPFLVCDFRSWFFIFCVLCNFGLCGSGFLIWEGKILNYGLIFVA